MANHSAGPTGPTWEGVDYGRVPPGRYSAIAIRIQGPQWLRRYGRWSLIVEFQLLSEDDARPCMFFNMGNDATKQKVGRQSRYFRAWTMANGELPKKGKKMNPQVFLDGQVFTIEVEDCGIDSERAQKADAEIYSRVSKIISADHSNHESINHESRIMQSPNQVINQSSRPG
jgi:hypothetical protein